MPQSQRACLWPALLLILFAGLFADCAREDAEDAIQSEYVAHFRDRAIDLESFLMAYPYSGIRAELEHGQLLYFDSQLDGKWLRFHDLDGMDEIALSAGRKVGEIDWSTRTFWEGRYHPPTERYYVMSDEKNDEHLNIYAMDLVGGEIEWVTQNDYTYAWNFSDDDRYLAYISRSGLSEPFVSRLMIRDMETGEEREILCDQGGADRFTWSCIAFTPDNRSVILQIQHDGDRRFVSLARIDLDDPSLGWLIPPRVKRYGLELLRRWPSESEFLYLSSESGFSNLYLYDLKSRRARQLTDYSEDVSKARLLGIDPPTVILTLKRPHETELQMLDVRTGEILYREVVDASAGIVDVHENRGILSLNELTAPLKLEWFAVDWQGSEASLSRRPLASMPEEVQRQIVHCKVEKVSYPTFDEDETGSQRMLHAFYLEPIDPPADPGERLVRITAFYGGGNYYSKNVHIMGAAGVATFSPAPRGSWGYGAEFSALNDEDLGGDEIVDIIYAAKWLVEEKGYKPHQIGVCGGSHGGYATMRCLTFPPETNGRDASFDFGFGVSHAGFSDITTFYETCNIPDWVVLEAGDPATERDKLLDRSPISHVELLSAPLLLTHGENDWRVPVSESRRFHERAKELGKPVVYVEFAGQGHGVKGLANNLVYYETVLGFLESLDAN